MNDKMKEELLEYWHIWKHDIQDMNRSEWTQRHQSILNTIETIIENDLNSEENKKLNAEIVRLKSLLHSAGLDLKKAEEVRLKLVNKLNKK
tara:strand:- start:12 stop:284 length:273 start_codon:yes stop_codon:yes gene_type:complete